MHLYHYPTYQTIECELQKLALGGKTKLKEPYPNNSACYTEMPDIGVFMDEWKSLYDSKSGERGIFNRESAKMQVERFGRRNPDYDFGTNPCSEIILRNNEFCNLTEVVVRPTDSENDLARKVRLASILGLSLIHI